MGERLYRATLLAGSTLTVMAGATITPALPAMEEAFAAVPAAAFWVKLALSLPAIFIALGGPLFGWLLDRWGRRPVLVLTVCLYALAGSSGFVLPSLAAILAGRALLGVAVSGTMTGFTTLIGDGFHGAELDRFMGLQGAATALGGVVFLLLGGLLADVGWRYPFLVYLLSLIVLPGVLSSVREPKRLPPELPTKTRRTPLPLRRLLPFYLLAFVGMLAFYLIPTQGAFHLRELGVESNTPVGVAVALMTLASAAGSLVYRRLRRRLSSRGIFALNFALMGLGYLLLGLADGYYGALTGLIIAGGGMGLFLPNLNVRLAGLVPEKLRGRAFGGSTTALYLGQFLSPILATPLVNRLNYAGLYLVTGGLMAIGALVGLLLSRKSGGDSLPAD